MTFQNRLIGFAALLGLLASMGCNIGPFRTCTTEARAGINVRAIDKVTRTNVLKGAVLHLSGAATEQITVGNDQPSDAVGMAFERAGVFNLSIEKTGHKPWEQTGITVTKDECHVIGVLITAELEPQ